MRRAVVTLTHQDIHKGEGPWTYFIPMTDAYCKAKSIPFHHIVLKNSPEDRHFSWARIPILHKFVQDFDEVMFISETATIINTSVNVFDFIKTTSEEPKWPRDTSVQPILYTLSDKSSDGHPLTGIFMLDCRNKAAANEFLTNWWNEHEPHSKQNFPYEQRTLVHWKKQKQKASLIRVANAWSIQEFDVDQVFIQITAAYSNTQIYEAKKYMFRMLNRKHRRVGLFVRQSNYYSSGTGQNVIFIKHCLEAAGYDVDLLIDHDPAKPSTVDPQIPYNYKSAKNLDYSQYVFILYGSYIPSEETRNRIKGLGIRTAIFHPMTSFDALHNDHFIHDLKTSVPLFEECFHKIADEVWLVRHQEATYKTMLEIQNKHKLPVRVVPLLWSPLFTLYNNTQYKYQNRDSNKLNIIVMDPNTSYVKSSLMPLVIAEAFYMKHKEQVNKVYVFGGQNAEATEMLNQFTLTKDSKIRKIGRMAINEIIKFFCHTEPEHKVAVISHNIQCPLNYAYYDVMNAGIPFLHNSHELRLQHLGYAYNTVSEGVTQLEHVLASHNPAEYGRIVQQEVAKIDPYAESNVRIFENLIDTRQFVHGCIVSTHNQERLEYMKKQFHDIHFPYKYSIFKAYTPETSNDYFDVEMTVPGFRPITSKLFQCGVRSHVAALLSCLDNTAADYFLMMEDDISFNTDINIKAVIERYIQVLEKHPEIHYLSLSYRPCVSVSDKRIHEHLSEFTKDDDVYWNLNRTLYGAQVYLISRGYAQKFVSMFHTSSMSELDKAVAMYSNVMTKYSSRFPQVIIDSLMPIFLNQGIVYPMMCVERQFGHSISSSNDLTEYMNGYVDLCKLKYYPPPPPPPPLQTSVSTCIVSTMNPKRVDFIQKQIQELKFPFEHQFYKSYELDSMKDYLDVSREEPELLLACMRSHIGALKHCLENFTSDYFLVLEDDVVFSTSLNIKDKIMETIVKMEAHGIDYVSLSYIPTYLDKSPIDSKLGQLKKDADLYWGFDIKENITFTIWGSQAYIISRKKAAFLVSLLNKSKISDVAASFMEYKSKARTYAHKTPLLTIDAIMPLLLNQGVLYPMLFIEKRFDDAISSSDERVSQWDNYCKRVPVKYYQA